MHLNPDTRLSEGHLEDERDRDAGNMSGRDLIDLLQSNPGLSGRTQAGSLASAWYDSRDLA